MDPVECEVVAKAVKDAGVTLECVLTTHSVRAHRRGNRVFLSPYPPPWSLRQHWDHAGGNEQVAKMFTGIKVRAQSGAARVACFHRCQRGADLWRSRRRCSGCHQ